MQSKSKIDYNLAVLDSIEQFKSNWNGYGAETYPTVLIEKLRELIRKLHIQPSIHPTASGSIQLEWENSDNSYLEMQFDNSNKIDCFKMDSNNNEENFSIDATSDAINIEIDKFCHNLP